MLNHCFVLITKCDTSHTGKHFPCFDFTNAIQIDSAWSQATAIEDSNQILLILRFLCGNNSHVEGTITLSA